MFDGDPAKVTKGLGVANCWIDSYRQLNNQSSDLVKMAIAKGQFEALNYLVNH
ncbi:hypothetical protein IQ218_05075 [Synechocystis salina LEGE 06099]|uniref:hypothetical protein n=1 Tax=Synechocystis salina TaxID=945780 RepID=UPI0018825AAE|nr:hypothetical protein [Synechocystis salina]MBE9202941.1 hypothetical protein [Synechocystis salina LEGE 06099]